MNALIHIRSTKCINVKSRAYSQLVHISICNCDFATAKSPNASSATALSSSCRALLRLFIASQKRQQRQCHCIIQLCRGCASPHKGHKGFFMANLGIMPLFCNKVTEQSRYLKHKIETSYVWEDLQLDLSFLLPQEQIQRRDNSKKGRKKYDGIVLQ